MPPVEIMKDLIFIERGYLNANQFVYRAKNPILIDTGFISDFHTTERLIRDLHVDPFRTGLIISTHTHCDHIGGNKIIQDRSDCEIALHRIGKHFIDIRDAWSTWWSYYDQGADFFTCTRALEDGEEIAIGPHEFRVLYTPGHASDGIVLYSRKEKVLISSDTLWEYDVATFTVRVEGSTALFRMMESLERLESLDVHRVYPGHGSPFADFKGALARSKEKVKDYMDHGEKCGAGLLKKILVYTILIHKRVDEKQFFLQLMEGHWFKETIDLYFDSEYQKKYFELIADFVDRGILERKDGKLFATVKP
ncbi:MAG: MBL fold metallo-hydrolase [Pseudomonadota bacterium]